MPKKRKANAAAPANNNDTNNDSNNNNDTGTSPTKKPRVASKATVAKAIATIAKDATANRKKAGPKRDRSINAIP